VRYIPASGSTTRLDETIGGVPKNIRYQTRHELALDMLKDNGNYLPHSWLAGDGDVWTKIDVRDGEKRPLITEIVAHRTMVFDFGDTAGEKSIHRR
jgi:hypothetical protein